VLLGLVYSIKPDHGADRITLTRQGDTATVIDTAGHADSTGKPDTVAFAPSDAPGSAPAATTIAPPAAPGIARPAGSSFPPVTPADLAQLRGHSLLIPVDGVTADKLVDSFDDARGGGGRRHEALDIMASRGTRVLSADAGRVLKLHNSVAGGLSIYVADPTQRFIMLYAHLDSYGPGLTEGLMVKKGELLGFVGSTGDASPAAPHLHFAVARSDNLKDWWKGTPLNPFLIYRGK
jgi:peptidoglycan LD-endopeptidase LytH